MKTFLTIILSVCLALAARAHTTVEKSFVCPLDGKTFKQTVDASGTQFGVRLDLKPIGPTPAPWILPQCPKCHFVLFTDRIDQENLQRLRAFVRSEQYREAVKDGSAYYCLGLIQASSLGIDRLIIADSFLQASWQMESDPAKCRKYLGMAMEKYTAARLKPDHKRYVQVSLLCGEIERRLGRFKEAEARFRSYRGDKVFADQEAQVAIVRQLSFIAKQDSAPRAALEQDEAKLR